MLRSGLILFDDISLGFGDGVKELIQPPPTTMTLGAMMLRKGDVFKVLRFWRLNQDYMIFDRNEYYETVHLLCVVPSSYERSKNAEAPLNISQLLLVMDERDRSWLGYM